MNQCIVEVTELENCLEIKLDPTLVEDFNDLIESLRKGSSSNIEELALVELLEPFWTNGKYEVVSPESIGALTNAPIVAEEWDFNSELDCFVVPKDAKVWWFPEYQTTSLIAELEEKGVVRLQLAREPEQKSQGQKDYEADVRKQPNYHDGGPRPSWDKLSDIAKWSWTRKA